MNGVGCLVGKLLCLISINSKVSELRGIMKNILHEQFMVRLRGFLLL